MKLLPIIAALWLLSCTAYSQTIAGFTPIKCEGEIPETFLQSVTDKYYQEKAQIDASKSTETERKVDKKRKKFSLQSSYVVDQLLMNGNVVFGDEISLYLNQIKDELLKDNPEISEKIEVYTVKSPVANAFTTGQGHVFVNLGLIAQLSTEAELAFIIAHEIEHYIKQHSVEFYLEKDNIENDKKRFNKGDLNDKLLARCAFSKDLEIEADEGGFNTFAKSGYTITAADKALKTLKSADLHYTDVRVSSGYFNSESFKIPEKLFKLKGEEIEYKSDDTESTHPSINKRRALISRLQKRIKEVDKKSAFVISEDVFKKVQKQSRYELSLIYYNYGSYGKAFYNSYALLKDDPNNTYLKSNVVYSLAAIAEMAHDGSKYIAIEGLLDGYNNENAAGKMLKSLSAKQLKLLAFREAYKLYEADTSEPHIKGVTEQLARDLIQNYDVFLIDMPTDLGIDTISNEQKTTNNDTLSEESFTEKSGLTDWEIDSIEMANANTKKVEKEDDDEDEKNSGTFVYKSDDDGDDDDNEIDIQTFDYAFVDLYKYANFEDFYGDIEGDVLKKNKDKKSSGRRSYTDKELKKIKIQGYKLGIDKVIVMDPYYLRVNPRKDEAIKIVDSDMNYQKMVQAIKKNAEIADLDIEFLSPKSFNANQSDLFNDYAQINGWFYSKLSMDDDLDIFSYQDYFKDELFEKYGTDKVLWTSALCMNTWNAADITSAFMYYIVPPLIPHGIYNAVNPNYATFYLSMLYDMSDGALLMANNTYIKGRDNNSVRNAHVYDVLVQIKKSK